MDTARFRMEAVHVSALVVCLCRSRELAGPLCMTYLCWLWMELHSNLNLPVHPVVTTVVSVHVKFRSCVL